MAKITLNGITMRGLNGELLAGLEPAEAKALVKELSQVWARDLEGDSLEIEQEDEDARVYFCAECGAQVEHQRAVCPRRHAATIYYGSHADRRETAEQYTAG